MIKWHVLKKATKKVTITTDCVKKCILKDAENKLLNKSSELISKCIHVNEYLMHHLLPR